MFIRRTCLLLALATAACGVPEDRADNGGEPTVAAAPVRDLPFPLTPAQERGRAIFESVCWTCHGLAGRGDGPVAAAAAGPAPPDLTVGEYPSLSGEQLLDRFEANAESADARHPHMRFVLSFMDREAFSDALGYIPALAYPPELPGSALNGRLLYQRHCAPCHGMSGDGRGSAADMLSMQPSSFRQDTLIATHRFEALHDKILQGGGLLHGSPMPAWGMFFDEHMAWDVVAYISSFQHGVLSEPPVPSAAREAGVTGR